MEAPIAFQISGSFVVPEYPLGTILLLVGCFAAFVATRIRRVKKAIRGIIRLVSMKKEWSVAIV
jgi:hypothetical protein